MKKLLSVLSISIILSVFLNFFIYLDFFSSLNYRFSAKLYDGKKEISKDIVIVKIDEKSFEDENLGNILYWNREYYNRVLDYLVESKAKIIAYDLIFSEPSKGISEETLKNLNGNSLKDYKNFQIHPYDQKFAETLKKHDNIILSSLAVLHNIEDFPAKLINLIDPLDIFKENTTTGIVYKLNSDQIMFSTSPAFNYSDNLVENFDFAVARRFLGLPDTAKLSDLTLYNYKFYDPPKARIKIDGEEIKTDWPKEEINVPLNKGDMMINYYFKPEDFDLDKYSSYTFADVYFGRVSKESFKDKIVLIGPYYLASGDLHFTPVSGNSKMYGVEIHANAIQTILDRDFIRVQGNLGKYILILVLGVLASLVYAYSPIILSVLGVFVLNVLYYFGAKFVFDKGYLMDMLYPFAIISLSFVGIYVYKYLSEYRGKLELKNAFSHYVNDELVKEVMKNPDSLKLGGEKKILSIMFSDVKGFTSVSENLKPEQVVSILNEYLEAMTNIILSHGGTVDKYEGDAIMAFWNAPLAIPDHALNACLAALECRRYLRSLHNKWKKEGKPLLDFRVGINTGEVVVGNIGSDRRFDYTIIGDNVNLASRLEGANKYYGTNLMISEFTKQEVSNHFIFRPIDLMRVKGKQKPVFTYEIICLKDELTPELESFLNEFNQAFNLYLKGLFKEAHKFFYALNKKFPNDALTKVYLLRCGEFLEKRPSSWDGVWVMEGK